MTGYLSLVKGDPAGCIVVSYREGGCVYKEVGHITQSTSESCNKNLVINKKKDYTYNHSVIYYPSPFIGY